MMGKNRTANVQRTLEPVVAALSLHTVTKTAMVKSSQATEIRVFNNPNMNNMMIVVCFYDILRRSYPES